MQLLELSIPTGKTAKESNRLRQELESLISKIVYDHELQIPPDKRLRFRMIDENGTKFSVTVPDQTTIPIERYLEGVYQLVRVRISEIDVSEEYVYDIDSLKDKSAISEYFGKQDILTNWHYDGFSR